MTPPRIPPEELRRDMLFHFRHMVVYWDAHPGMSPRDKLSGLLHSILCYIDGVSGSSPCAFDLVCRPHPDDKQFNIDEGDRWVQDGDVINAGLMLHEELYSPEGKRQLGMTP